MPQQVSLVDVGHAMPAEAVMPRGFLHALGAHTGRRRPALQPMGLRDSQQSMAWGLQVKERTVTLPP